MLSLPDMLSSALEQTYIQARLNQLVTSSSIVIANTMSESNPIIVSDDSEEEDEVRSGTSTSNCQLRRQLSETSYKRLMELLRDQAKEDEHLGLCMCPFCTHERNFKYISIFIDLLCNPY